jgi:hypothetical protein
VSAWAESQLSGVDKQVWPMLSHVPRSTAGRENVGKSEANRMHDVWLIGTQSFHKPQGKPRKHLGHATGSVDSIHWPMTHDVAKMLDSCRSALITQYFTPTSAYRNGIVSMTTTRGDKHGDTDYP